ncbi:MAG: HPt (histidine-containing phosphotransfer) domain-containing protein [Cyclobacteriaceae bacterium]
MTALKTAIEHQQNDTIFSIAHEIKAVAANLDGLELTRLSTSLEAMGQAHTDVDDIVATEYFATYRPLVTIYPAKFYCCTTLPGTVS